MKNRLLNLTVIPAPYRVRGKLQGAGLVEPGMTDKKNGLSIHNINGFSLIEVMVVLILVSLSMFLATPLLSGFSKTVELKGATKKISAILRYCRSEAVNQGRVYQAVFDPDQRQVRIESIEEKEEDEGSSDQIKDAAKESKQKTYTLPKGVDIKEVKANSPEYASDFAVIEFYPNGGSNGGMIRLDSPDRKGYRIKVHFLTGIVEIEKV